MMNGSVTTSDEDLDALIDGLEEYFKQGVCDPWVLSNGKHIEPLHILYELRAFRRGVTKHA